MSYPSPKSVIVIDPESITNGGTASDYIDTLGYAYAIIDTMASTSNAATNNFSVLTLSESDDTEATNFSNVAAFVGDSSFVIPSANTSESQIVAQFRVNLRSRKRYLKISASPLTTQTIWAHARLYTGDEEMPSETLTGAAEVVVG